MIGALAVVFVFAMLGCLYWLLAFAVIRDEEEQDAANQRRLQRIVDRCNAADLSAWRVGEIQQWH